MTKQEELDVLTAKREQALSDFNITYASKLTQKINELKASLKQTRMTKQEAIEVMQSWRDTYVHIAKKENSDFWRGREIAMNEALNLIAQLDEPKESTTNLASEWCPHCGSTSCFEWNTEVNGYQVYCLYCGGEMLLCGQCGEYDRCDECPHGLRSED